MQNSLIIDTGYFIAIASPNDKWHKRACELTATLDQQYVTTWAVLTETAHYLTKTRSQQSVWQLLHLVAEGVLLVIGPQPEDAKRLADLTKKYADLPMDLADASLVVLAERLGHGNILSTDQRDFGAYRWKNTKPFRNLLIPE